MFKFLNWKVGQCQFGEKQGIIFNVFGLCEILCTKSSKSVSNIVLILTNVKFIISDLFAHVVYFCTSDIGFTSCNIVIFKIIVEI